MKNRLLFGALVALIHFPAVADTYRDALAALNSGHLDVARQMANGLAQDHPDRTSMLRSIDTAVAEARTPKQYQLTVDELEQQQVGKVFRSLEDPQLMEQLYAELDSASSRHAAARDAENNIDAQITVDQQLAMLREKMDGQPLTPAANTPGLAGPRQLEQAVGQSEQVAQSMQTGQPDTDPQIIVNGSSASANSTNGRSCLSPDKIKSYFSKARTDAAAFAMDKARAIAKANEIRQQRALARMRLEITAEITRKVRRELDSRFDKEVSDRVAALTAGQQKRDLESLAALNDGQAELMLANRHHADDTGRTWLELAAKKGNVEAQFELGQQYFQPKLGDPDYTAAAHWWQLAQVAGHPDAAAALSLLRQRQIPSLANNAH